MNNETDAGFQRFLSEDSVQETEKNTQEQDGSYIHQDDTLLYILIVIAIYAIVIVVLMFKFITTEYRKDHRVHAREASRVNEAFVLDDKKDDDRDDEASTTTSTETSSLRRAAPSEWYTSASSSSLCSSSRSSVSLLSRINEETKEQLRSTRSQTATKGNNVESYVVSVVEPSQSSPTKRLNVSKANPEPVYV